ncbi:MAG TPA: hypothetical protein VMT72_01940 [Pseudolabrys sp.]|nr:hypothetical protein [Pseudolabrys sp.]
MDSIFRALQLAIAFGAPRPMKMGTTASPWRYDAAARDAFQLSSLRWPSGNDFVNEHWIQNPRTIFLLLCRLIVPPFDRRDYQTIENVAPGQETRFMDLLLQIGIGFDDCSAIDLLE